VAFAAFGSGAPAKDSSTSRKSGPIVLVLLLPGLIYLGLFFMTPLLSLIVTALESPAPSGAIGAYVYDVNFMNFVNAITRYLPQILRSFGYAFAATVFALLISYPLAYLIGVKLRNSPLIQRLLLTLVIAPFFISFLLRTIAWTQLLSDNSGFVALLHTLHILGPNQSFLGTDAAVIFGLTYNFIPFMTLPLFTNLERLDTRLLEAAGDLYASPSRVFRKITLPLSMPGIISGTLLTFIPIAGDYVNASQDFLGSSKTSMIGTMVEADFLKNLNYPSASALSVLLMGLILILVSVYVRRSGTEDLL